MSKGSSLINSVLQNVELGSARTSIKQFKAPIIWVTLNVTLHAGASHRPECRSIYWSIDRLGQAEQYGDDPPSIQ